MDPSIRITIKPDYLSWDTIHDVIWASHKENRDNGVIMSYPSLSGDKIKQKLGEDGKMLVALNTRDELVGTAAIIPKESTLWFGRFIFAYCCFAAILPEYNGKGIYKEMCRVQEEMAKEMGLSMMLFDTHEKNFHNLDNSVKAGYRFVDMKYYNDHYNVVMVKWLNGCPYSRFRCSLNFLIRRIIVHIRTNTKCVIKLS